MLFRSAELEQVWQQTRVVPVPDWESRADTRHLAADDTGPYRLNEDLRGLSDARSYDKYEERPGGHDQLYGEDDL